MPGVWISFTDVMIVSEKLYMSLVPIVVTSEI